MFGDSWSYAFFVRWLRLAHFLFYCRGRRIGVPKKRRRIIEDSIFANPGKKLKKIAQVVFVLTIIIGVIGAIVQFYFALTNGEMKLFFTAMITIVLSIVAAYVASLGLYAFGELVEDTHQIKYIAYKTAQSMQADDETSVATVE